MNKRPHSKTGLVLLSGGMDSSTCLAIAVSEGFKTYTLAFDYGQKHRFELEMARRQAEAFRVMEHKVMSVDLNSIVKSALTGQIQVSHENPKVGIPSTYVSARNIIFLSLGLAWAELLDVQDIFIGANQVDYSGYPDCRREFLDAYEHMANVGTRMGVEGKAIRIRAPLIYMTKAQIITRGIELGVDFRNTHTCYDPTPEARACGQCPSCIFRLKGFSEAGLKDPISYEKRF